MSQLNGRGKVMLLVEKRTYRPAGWAKIKEVTVEARFTKKRIYAEGWYKRVFDRETGEEIQDQESRIWQSIRYSVISTAVFESPVANRKEGL